MRTLTEHVHMEHGTSKPRLYILALLDDKELIDLCGSAETILNRSILHLDHVRSLTEAALASQMTNYDLAIIDGQSAHEGQPCSVDLRNIRVPFIAVTVNDCKREGLQALDGGRTLLLRFMPSVSRLGALVGHSLRMKNRD